MTKEAYSKNNILLYLGYNKDGYAFISIDLEDMGLREMIEYKFNLKPEGEIIMDIVGDQGIIKYKNNLEFTWDAWYPFNLESTKEESNILLEEIFEWLQTIEIPIQNQALALNYIKFYFFLRSKVGSDPKN